LKHDVLYRIIKNNKERKEEKMNNVKLLPVKNKKILEEHGVYFSPGTLRRWHYQRIHPEIFAKVGGSLFINFNEWQKLIAQKTRLAKKTAKKIQELG